MVTAGIFWALLLVSARSVTGLPIRRRLMHEVAVASPGLCFMFHRLSVRAAPSFFFIDWFLLVSYRPLAALSSRTLKTTSGRRNAAQCTRYVAAMTAARVGQRWGCLSGCWEKLINGRE